MGLAALHLQSRCSALKPTLHLLNNKTKWQQHRIHTISIAGPVPRQCPALQSISRVMEKVIR